MRASGIDVSVIQGNVPWDKVSESGVTFTILRCGVGNDTPDRKFGCNATMARNYGLDVGAYHFVYPLAHIDPSDAAKYHFSLCQNAQLTLPTSIDIEWPSPDKWAKWQCTPDSIKEWSLTYLEQAETLYGVKPVIYTYPWFWKSLNADSDTDFGKYPLWIADYSGSPHGIPQDSQVPVIPKPWSDWYMWQYSGGGVKLPNGVPVDGDVMNSPTIHHEDFIENTPGPVGTTGS